MFLDQAQGHLNEKPMHSNRERPSIIAARKNPCSNEDPVQPKINKKLKKSRLCVKGLQEVVFSLRSTLKQQLEGASQVNVWGKQTPL